MQTIDKNTLKQRLDRNEQFTFLNVLPNESYQQEHIPRSENLPYNDDPRFEEKVEQKAGGKNKEIVLYCGDNKCETSGKAVKRLEKAGFTNIKHYKGGMKEWKEAGFPVEGRRQRAA